MTELIPMAMNKLKYKLFQAAYDPEAEKMAAKNKASENNATETIKTDTVILYEEPDFKGKSHEFKMGDHNVQLPSIKSIKVPNGLGLIYMEQGRENTIDINISNDEKSFDKIKVIDLKAAAAEAAAKPKDPMTQFWSSFKNTFLGFLIPALIVFVCSTVGSIAANDAIGRHWAIRLVYFIYGTFPVFAPFVGIYYIYRYFNGTYPVWYNFLPLTTTIWNNWFMQFITRPFTYQIDANILYMSKKFDESAAKFIY